MTLPSLWLQLVKHEWRRSYFFGRPIVTISHTTFEEYKSEFIPHYSIFNNLQNFRSRHAWRHIHAIVYPEYVQIHIDHGNPNNSWLYYVPHLFLDVVPYFTFCLSWRKKPYYFD